MLAILWCSIAVAHARSRHLESVRGMASDLMGIRDWVDDRNAQWGAGLRRVSLIAELEVDDDDAERAIRTLGAVLRRNRARLVAAHHPAFLLVALTYAGMTSWEEGTFYAKVAASMGCTKEDAEDATKAFHTCLDRFDLPKFDEAGGMRWITPVLLHGGIPLDHLDELLDLLATRRRRDPSTSGESFVEWTRLNPRAVAMQPKALVRFLQYGGDFAPDFVGRVIDLIDGQDVILPRRSRERLDDLIAQGRVVRPSVRREVRPSFAVLDNATLIVRLPGVRPQGAERDVEWRVHQGGHVDTVTASVPWTAGAHLTEAHAVEILAPVRDITVERDGSATVLPLVRAEDPLLVFDADGEYVPITRPVPAGTVTVMWPSGPAEPPVDRDGNPWPGDDLDVPYGWDGWTQRQGEVAAGGVLRWRDGPVHRVAGADKARVVVGDRHGWVQTRDGFDVTLQRPSVVLPAAADPRDWTVLVSTRRGNVVERVAPTGQVVELLATVPAPVASDLVVSVKGPLGRGVERRVVLVEQLDVHCEPEHRPLASTGGLVEANLVMRCDGRDLGEWSMGARQRDVEVEIDELQLVVTPPHTRLSWVSNDVPGPWTVEPVVVSAEQVVQGALRVDGLTGRKAPRLVFESGYVRQELLARRARRTSCEFDLSALRDAVIHAGSGVLHLSSDSMRARVATIRPKRLAETVKVEHGRLHVDTTVAEPLEALVYRLAAPWEPERVVTVDSPVVGLPEELVGRGPLRVLVRRVDEWTSAVPAGIPQLGIDVFDVAQPWHADREAPEDRVLCAWLVGDEVDGDGVVASETVDHAVQAIAIRNLPVRRSTRVGIAELLRANPQAALEGLSTTNASTDKITFAVVASGLASAPAGELDRPDLAETLLARSPLAATLASSASIHRHGVSAPAAALLASALGESLVDLWGGQPDHAAVGMFIPQFLEHPELAKAAFDYLAPVPQALLDDDSRTVACYRMWQMRRCLVEPSEAAMTLIQASQRVLHLHDVDLWPMVQARVSSDGVIALPALSIALALVSRVAAYQEGPARSYIANGRLQYGDMALFAPDLVAIDLIRADAAVIGALR